MTTPVTPPPTGPGIAYVGTELELFAGAVRWKSYVRDRLAPHLRGRVLEVGAGIGGFTRLLAPLAPAFWCCLEPDPRLLAEVEASRARAEIPAGVRTCAGTLLSLPAADRFDTILYLDVLEHIEDDRGEVARAAALLAPGGRLIVLGPALPFVYSSFDAAIGHHRRYTRTMLESIRADRLHRLAAFYMDAPGLLLSLGNRLLLRRNMPRPAQIAFWDRVVVPAARLLDPVVGRSFGRSVVVIWQRTDEPGTA